MSTYELIGSATQVNVVSADSALQFREAKDDLVAYVDKHVSESPDIDGLLGPNTIELLFDNHRNHVDFMGTVFRIANHELLARTVPWVYHAYTSRGLSPAYFPFALRLWKEAARVNLSEKAANDVGRIYDWMLDHHTVFLALANEATAGPPTDGNSLASSMKCFLEALLEGDRAGCGRILRGALSDGHSLDQVYVQVVQAAMTEIGLLWENGSITVAQEHLASAIVGQVLASLDTPISERISFAGKAVVTAAPNEFHEIGAWMIYDLLDAAGWDVRYFGADTTAHRLLSFLHEFEPNLLALSVTMPFNIPLASDIIDAVRKDHSLTTFPDIVVGGRAFETAHDLWETTGADTYLADAHAFKTYIQAAV